MACPYRRLPGKFNFTRNKIGTWHASVDVCLSRKFHFTHTVYNRMGTWHARVDVYQGNFILPTLYTTDGNMACSCRRLPGKFHFTHNKIGTWHASADACLPGKFHFTHTTYNRMGAWLVKWTRRTSRATARENKKSDARLIVGQRAIRGQGQSSIFVWNTQSSERSCN